MDFEPTESMAMLRGSAREFADQGCVILPRGRNDVFFTPRRLYSTLPHPATQPWPKV